MSAYERDEQSPLKEEKETYLRSRTIPPSKYTNGGDAFHGRAKCGLQMKNSAIEATYEDQELYN